MNEPYRQRYCSFNSSRSRRLCSMVALNFDLAFAHAHLCEIEVNLHAKPGLGRAAKRLRQSHRHLGRNTALSADKIVERLTRDAEHLCGVGDTEAQGLQAVDPHRYARVRRVLHRHDISPSASDNRLNSHRSHHGPRRRKTIRQLARMVTLQNPFNSPFNGCSLNPGSAISSGLAARSSWARMVAIFSTCSALRLRRSSLS